MKRLILLDTDGIDALCIVDTGQRHGRGVSLCLVDRHLDVIHIDNRSVTTSKDIKTGSGHIHTFWHGISVRSDWIVCSRSLNGVLHGTSQCINCQCDIVIDTGCQRLIVGRVAIDREILVTGSSSGLACVAKLREVEECTAVADTIVRVSLLCGSRLITHHSNLGCHVVVTKGIEAELEAHGVSGEIR